MGRWVSVIAVLVFLHGAGASAQDKGKDAPKTIGMHLLDRDAGANFGDWVVWRYDIGDKAIFLINQKTGYAVYLPWTSNGWINYRTKDGEWHVLFSKGNPEKQDRSDLMIKPFLGKRPAVHLAEGKFKFEGVSIENGQKVTYTWTVNVTKDYIDFHSAAHDDRMTIRRASGEIVHNGRSIGIEKK